MLAPHHAENSQLRKRRIAPQYFLRACVFFRREAVLGRNLRSYLNFSLNHFVQNNSNRAGSFNLLLTAARVSICSTLHPAQSISAVGAAKVSPARKGWVSMAR